MIPEVSSHTVLPSSYIHSLFFRILGLELRASHMPSITVPLSSVPELYTGVWWYLECIQYFLFTDPC